MARLEFKVDDGVRLAWWVRLVYIPWLRLARFLSLQIDWNDAGDRINAARRRGDK